MITVRHLIPDDLAAVTELIEGLPDYFTEDVPEKVAKDATDHRAWVLVDEHTVVGIAVVELRSAAGAEILWMAVADARRGQGRGNRAPQCRVRRAGGRRNQGR